MYGVATARPEGTGFAVPIDAGAPPADRRREWMKARPRAGGPNRSRQLDHHAVADGHAANPFARRCRGCAWRRWRQARRRAPIGRASRTPVRRCARRDCRSARRPGECAFRLTVYYQEEFHEEVCYCLGSFHFAWPRRSCLCRTAGLVLTARGEHRSLPRAASRRPGRSRSTPRASSSATGSRH